MIDKKLNETIIDVAIKVARRGEGGLIIVGACKYKPLVEQNVPPFDVRDNPKLLESLVLTDGAVIIKHNGIFESFGTKLNSNNILKNFGTRHSAAVSASMNKGTTAYIISEEDKKVRIFKDGKMIMQIDALEKNVERVIPEITKIINDIGIGTIASIGASIIIPNLAIAFIPGVLVFGSTSWALRKIRDMEKGR